MKKQFVTVYSITSCDIGVIETFKATIEDMGYAQVATNKHGHSSGKLGVTVFLTKEEAVTAAKRVIKAEIAVHHERIMELRSAFEKLTK